MFQHAACRAVPLWGAIRAGGFAEICFHQTKKLNGTEWNHLLVSGRVLGALKRLQPERRRAFWTVLCDNESFMKTKENVAESARRGIQMWHVPPQSFDLNPIEKYWVWLRYRLRKADLEDLRQKEATAYEAAVQAKGAEKLSISSWHHRCSQRLQQLPCGMPGSTGCRRGGHQALGAMQGRAWCASSSVIVVLMHS